MPSVFKIYLHGISDSNMIWRSDEAPDEMNGDLILSPKLKKEINKADGFDFMILPSSFHYDSFEKKKTILFLTRDNKCIFRGRVSEVKTDIFKQRTITCEGDLAFLADTIQSPNKRTNTSDAGSTEKKKRETLYYGFDGSSSTSDSKLEMTAENYFRGLIGEHNVQANGYGKGFEIGTLNVPSRFDSEKFERTSYQNTSSIISSDLLSVYGGVLRTRYENNTAYIDWLEDYTTTSEQSIRFGLNMIEMDQEPPSDDVWSVLLPVGEDNVTIADVNGGSIYLENSDAITKYGYIVHCHQFNNVKKASDLKRKAEQYLMIHGLIFPDNLIVKAIDLQLIGESNDPLELGEKIKVVSEPHNVDTTMSCIAMELDIFNPENNSYTIGTIMPPDKEKRQDSLSSKQSESSSRHSKGIGDNANKIGKLNEDINVNANNINVNAKNIAVNALNIAVNAENIAIVAKNIAIAADTIDIKAREITAAFGEETEELHGYIQASADGIKTSFTNNITGLSSYISQTAGEISAGVQNAAGTLSSKITLTEQNLTTEFNKKLYGPSQDGTGGLVADYEHKIKTSADGTIETFQKTLYGENGTEENPSITSFYYRVRSDTAQESRDYFAQTLYGPGGSAENPKANTILHAVYTKSANAWQNVIWGENGSAENPEEGSILKGTKDAIEARVTKTTMFGDGGTQDDPKTGSVMAQIRLNADQIVLRVKKDEVVSTINQTADSVTIKASKIALDGVVLTDHLTSTYATIASLNTTNANITNLTSGSTKATHLKATTLSADTLQVYRNAGAASEYQIYYPSMIKRGGSSYYSNYVLSTNSSGELDLSHSHSVSTGSDGTITIGGAVSTDATNRSFRIADTKTYKDGVSAARLEGVNSVTVDSVGLNTTDYSNGIGDSPYQDYAIYYDIDDHEYHARIRADASNGKHREASITFSGNKAYSYGEQSVTVNSVGLNTTDYSNGIGDSPYQGYAIYYDIDDHDYHVLVRADASNGSHRESRIDFTGNKAYNAGYSEGVVKGREGVTVSSVYVNDGETYATNDDDWRNDCANMKLSISLSNGKTIDQGIGTVHMWQVYAQGLKDAITNDAYCTNLSQDTNGDWRVTINIDSIPGWGSASRRVKIR